MRCSLNFLKPAKALLPTNMHVIIDGIEYVPKAEVPELTDERLRKALGELVSIQYFREHHKAVAQSWDVLNCLAPELAKLAAQNPSAAYKRIHGCEEE